MIVLLQWSVVWQSVGFLALFTFFVYTRIAPLPTLEVLKEGVQWQSSQCQVNATLLYLNEYWMMLVLHPKPNSSLWQRLIIFCIKYQLIYRDQFDEPEYRLLRSKLFVQKLLDSPAQKNESEALK